MPIIKLSQYPKYSIPLEIQGQINQLQRMQPEPELHDDERRNALICTLSQDGKILAFSELSLGPNEPRLVHLAVHPAQRQKGLGSILFTHTLRKLRSLGHDYLQLQCEVYQKPFFERFSCVALDTEHRPGQLVSMVLPCVRFVVEHLPQSALTKGKIPDGMLQLGLDSTSYHFRSEEDYIDLHKTMLNQARKRVWLLCETAQSPLLQNQEISDALQRMIRRHPHAEVRILLANDKAGAGYFNPCIHLAQRLSSYFEIRTLQNTGLRMKEMVSLIDFNASIFRKNAQEVNGFGCFYNRLLYERMRSNYDNHWQFAKPSQQLRRLAI